MSSAFLHILDVLLGTLVLRALLGWLVQNPRVLKLLVPLAAAAVVLLFNVSAQLPLLTMLIVFIVTPLAVLLLLSALSEMRSLSQSATMRAMFLPGRGKSRGAAPELAAALRELSGSHVGALIVLPREDELERLVTGGEIYDAKLTKSLVVSLFNPESPRHDGALVLQGDRVTRVGAVLPLASAEGAREEWGTRHLAAAGLSENCDADVLVVSEERGTVSHARKGKMVTLPLDSDKALAARLEKIVGGSDGAAASFGAASKSVMLWALALALAIAGSFSGERLAARTFSKPALITSREVPINLINVPQGLFVDSLSAGKCELLVQIPENWFAIGNVTWPVTIDLDGYKPGPINIRLTRELIPNFPAEGAVYRIKPEHVTFTLAPVRQLNIPVTTRFDGLPKEYKIDRSATTPASIAAEVRDPKWKASQRVETYPIDLSKVNAPGEYHFETWLNLPASITQVDSRPESYKVSATVHVAAIEEVPK